MDKDYTDQLLEEGFKAISLNQDVFIRATASTGDRVMKVLLASYVNAVLLGLILWRVW